MPLFVICPDETAADSFRRDLESMTGEEFNYYFEHHEFMPEEMKESLKAKKDSTIERPAKKIKMFDEAPEAPSESESSDPPDNGNE